MKAFLSRFYFLSDSLLQKVEITYTRSGQRNITVQLASRDAAQEAKNGWACVRLTIFEAQDYCFSDAANTTAGVISHGVHFCWFDEIVGIDFGHFVDPPETLNELKTSKFFVTGKSVEWSAEPI